VTLNGPVASSTAGVSVSAYNNFVQNSTISAAGAVAVAVSAGTISYGAQANTVGNPISYTAGGVAALLPNGSISTGGNSPVTVQSNSLTDFLNNFFDQFDNSLAVQTTETGFPRKKQDDEGVVVEGYTCTR
jgi:hypothetical protein